MKRLHNIITETPLPSGYTRLQYIESTGTQYIDTGISPNPSSVFDIDFQYVSGNYGDTNYFGCEDYNSIYCRIYWRTNLNPQYIGSLYCDNNNIQGWRQSSGYTNRHLWHIESNNMQCDGITVLTTNTVTHSTNLHFILFASNMNGNIRNYSKARLYFFEGKDSNLHKIMIPALRTADNTPGLYDLVNNQFYTNAGTGEFLYG